MLHPGTDSLQIKTGHQNPTANSELRIVYLTYLYYKQYGILATFKS